MPSPTVSDPGAGVEVLVTCRQLAGAPGYGLAQEACRFAKP